MSCRYWSLAPFLFIDLCLIHQLLSLLDFYLWQSASEAIVAEGNAFDNLRLDFWSRLSFWNSFALKFAALSATSNCSS